MQATAQTDREVFSLTVDFSARVGTDRSSGIATIELVDYD